MIPKGAADKKPPHGQPCTNCGLCCMATLCPLGRHVFGREAGPCPALHMDEKGSVCGLVEAPAQYAPVRAALHGADVLSEGAKLLVGAGWGCDARINGEPADRGFYDRLRALDRIYRSRVRAAKRAWGA